MKQILNASGKNVTDEIGEELESYYNRFRSELISELDIRYIQGKIQGLEKTLAILGRTHEVKIEIKEVGKA